MSTSAVSGLTTPRRVLSANHPPPCIPACLPNFQTPFACQSAALSPLSSTGRVRVGSAPSDVGRWSVRRLVQLSARV